MFNLTRSHRAFVQRPKYRRLTFECVEERHLLTFAVAYVDGPGYPPVPGVRVHLTDASGTDLVVTTNAAGVADFGNALPFASAQITLLDTDTVIASHAYEAFGEISVPFVELPFLEPSEEFDFTFAPVLQNLTFTQNAAQQSIDPRVELLDTQTVRFTYADQNAAFPETPTFAIYSSPTPRFDASTAVPLSAVLSLPALDDKGRSTSAVGDHRVTMTLPSDLKNSLSGGSNFLLIVLNPPTATHPNGTDLEWTTTDNSAVLGQLTPSQFRSLFPSANQTYLTALNDTLREFGIVTTERQAGFFSQIAAETAGLTLFGETSISTTIVTDRATKAAVAMPQQGAWSSKVVFYYDHLYNGANGNVVQTDDQIAQGAVGDGYQFRGGGAMQLTGRANYQAASNYLGTDLVANPDLIRNVLPSTGPVAGRVSNPEFNPSLAFRTAGWFFAVKNDAGPTLRNRADSLVVDFSNLNSRASMTAEVSVCNWITQGVGPKDSAQSKAQRIEMFKTTLAEMSM